jgi:hypothetical protein
VDVCAEELHNSVTAKVAIHADIGVFTRQLIQQLASQAWIFPVINPWWGQLNSKSDKNKAIIMVSQFLGLFNGTCSTARLYITLNIMLIMNDKFGTMWKEMHVTYSIFSWRN